MTSLKQIADQVQRHFQVKAQHTANVLAGPRRETWFSSEMFVAVSELAAYTDLYGRRYGQLTTKSPRAAPRNRKKYTTSKGRPSYPFETELNLAVYGEQYARSLDPNLQDTNQPDLVVFDPNNTQGSSDEPRVAIVIEVKLCLFRKDSQRARSEARASLKELKTQLDDASRAFPGAVVAGVVFLAGLPGKDDTRPAPSASVPTPAPNAPPLGITVLKSPQSEAEQLRLRVRPPPKMVYPIPGGSGVKVGKPSYRFHDLVKEVRDHMEQELPDTEYEWVDGHDLQPVFGYTKTSFAYPETHVALNMGVRVRRAKTPGAP